MIKRIKYYKILVLAMALGVSTLGYTQDLIEQETDGELTVSAENTNAAENSEKVIDNNIETKFLLYTFEGLTIQYKFSSAKVVDGYSITSANDAQDRDPRDWKLQGSNDGETWTTIHTVTNTSFDSRYFTKSFDLTNNIAYAYYRLNISAIKSGGNGLFQLAEWRLFKVQAPPAPSDLSVTSTAPTENYLSWTDNSTSAADQESYFIVERAAGAGQFMVVDSVGADVNTYTDGSAMPNTSYEYRVKAVRKVSSGYSNTVSVSTSASSGIYGDVTDDGGSLFVEFESDNENENSPKIIDNNYGTKYLYGASTAAFEPLWVAYTSSEAAPLLLTKYRITTGNDAPDRDPKAWALKASVDSATWDLLDARSGVEFDKRSTTNTFLISGATAKAYKYFVLDVTSNNGSSAFQFAELEIFGYAEGAVEIPTNLAVSDSTFESIEIMWQDNSSSETGFIVERSEDGVSYEVIGELAANVNTFSDTDLGSYTKYYYRVQSVKSGSKSRYSEVLETITAPDPKIPVAPINVAGEALSAYDIKLTWEDITDNEDGFIIERSLDSINFKAVNQVGADVEEFVDGNLKKGIKYYYRVKAFNGFGATQVPPSYIEVITLGSNFPPGFNTVDDQVACAVDTRYQVLIDGITAGEGEADQKLQFSVSTDFPELFNELEITSTTTDFTYLNYTTTTDTIPIATVTITLKDDGGNNNGGVDTYEQTFLLTVDSTIVSASVDTSNPVERGAVITLSAEGGVSYHWQDAPGYVAGQDKGDVQVKPTQDFPYVVDILSPQGCVLTDTVTVKMAGSYAVEPNNILTPNNDGYNDTWVIWNVTSFEENEVKVFDRSGRTVYSAINYDNSWDGTADNGKKLESGVYYYAIILGRGLPRLTGSLTIIH